MRLLQLGADEVIDYRQERFEEVLKGRPVDAVLDAVVHGDAPCDYEQRRCGGGSSAGTHAFEHAAGHRWGPAEAWFACTLCSMKVLKKTGTYVNFIPKPMLLPILIG